MVVLDIEYTSAAMLRNEVRVMESYDQQDKQVCIYEYR